MKHAAKKERWLWLGYVLVSVMLSLAPLPCLAQQGAPDLPEYYPDSFSGQGCIDRITSDRVIINDHSIFLAPDAVFHTLKTQYAPRNRFKAGWRVGYLLNSENKIVSLWYLAVCH